MGLFFNNQDIANAGITEKAVLYSRSRFSWGLSEIGATKPDGARLLREAPAAFGRLCVEMMTSHDIDGDDVTSRLRAAIYQYNSEISYNKGRLKTLSIGFQTTFFSHQHKPDTLE